MANWPDIHCMHALDTNGLNFEKRLPYRSNAIQSEKQIRFSLPCFCFLFGVINAWNGITTELFNEQRSSSRNKMDTHCLNAIAKS